MSLTAAERETTLSLDDEAQVWLISSFRRADITRLKKNPDLVIEDEGTFEGTPFLRGTLPMGGISIRTKSAGTIKRKTSKAKGMPLNAATCNGTKTNGEKCGSLAKGSTGFCLRHQDQVK